MTKQKKIRSMKFPHSDRNWEEVNLFVKNHGFYNLQTIAPVEFCVELENCVPYEWSYWQDLSQFECIILHKGMVECFKNDFLNHLTEKYDYIFGNNVFKVFVLTELNNNNLIGDNNHLLDIKPINNKTYPNDQKQNIQNIHNILLVTANNNGNIGDDAITYAAFDMLHDIFPEATIIIDKAPASKQLISTVDLVVLGGGGIFYDNCFYNAQNYCQYFLYAHELGIKSCAIGIGALGINSTLGIELFKNSTDLAEFIVVRDKNSFRSLTFLVNTTTPVFIKNDVAFTLKSEGNIAINTCTNKPILLFSLSDAANEPNLVNYHQSQFDCMKFLVKHFEVKLLVQSTDDKNMYQLLSQKFDLSIVEVPYKHIKGIIDLYQQGSLVITSRLHGFIFASIAKTPVLTITSNKENSKLNRLINDSIPSLKPGFIFKKNYNFDLLNEKINLFFDNPNQFVANNTEVKACQKLANETSDVIRHYLLS